MIAIKPSHKGRLHSALHVPQGKKLSAVELARARKSSDPHMRKMAQFAINAKHFKH